MDFRTYKGNTLLHQAAYQTVPNVMVELIHLGADPTLRNCEKKTPIECSKDPTFQQMLLGFMKQRMSKSEWDAFARLYHPQQVEWAHARWGWAVTRAVLIALGAVVGSYQST